MLEMEYQKEKTCIILDKGNYEKFNYVIVSYGTHPCCYISIPQKHKFFEKNYDDIDIDCHGGLTFSDYRDFGCGLKYYIGWDYAHFNDYIGYYELDCLRDSPFNHDDDKRWTTEELLEDVKKVIEQLKEIN